MGRRGETAEDVELELDVHSLCRVRHSHLCESPDLRTPELLVSVEKITLVTWTVI